MNSFQWSLRDVKKQTVQAHTHTKMGSSCKTHYTPCFLLPAYDICICTIYPLRFISLPLIYMAGSGFNRSEIGSFFISLC